MDLTTKSFGLPDDAGSSIKRSTVREPWVSRIKVPLSEIPEPEPRTPKPILKRSISIETEGAGRPQPPASSPRLVRSQTPASLPRPIIEDDVEPEPWTILSPPSTPVSRKANKEKCERAFIALSARFKSLEADIAEHPTWISKTNKKDLSSLGGKLKNLQEQEGAENLLKKITKMVNTIDRLKTLQVHDFLASAPSGGEPDMAAFEARMGGAQNIHLNREAIHVLDVRRTHFKQHLQYLTKKFNRMERRLLFRPISLSPDDREDLKGMHAELLALRKEYRELKADTTTIYKQQTTSMRIKMSRTKRKVDRLVSSTEPTKSLVKIEGFISKLNELIRDAPRPKMSPEEQAHAILKTREKLSTYWTTQMKQRLHPHKGTSLSAKLKQWWHHDASKAAALFMGTSHHFLKALKKDKEMNGLLPQTLLARQYDIQKLLEEEIPDTLSDTEKMKQMHFFLDVAKECHKKNDSHTAEAILLALLRMNITFNKPTTYDKKLQDVQKKCMELHRKITQDTDVVPLDMYKLKLDLLSSVQNIHTLGDQLCGAPLRVFFPLKDRSLVYLNRDVVPDLPTQTMVIGSKRIEATTEEHTIDKMQTVTDELRLMFDDVLPPNADRLSIERVADITNMLGSSSILRGLNQMMMAEYRGNGFLAQSSDRTPEVVAVKIDGDKLVFQAEQTLEVYQSKGAYDQGERPKYVVGVTEIQVPLNTFLKKGLEALSLNEFTAEYSSKEYYSEPLALTRIAFTTTVVPEWLGVEELYAADRGIREKLKSLRVDDPAHAYEKLMLEAQLEAVEARFEPAFKLEVIKHFNAARELLKAFEDAIGMDSKTRNEHLSRARLELTSATQILKDEIGDAIFKKNMALALGGPWQQLEAFDQAVARGEANVRGARAVAQASVSSSSASSSSTAVSAAEAVSITGAHRELLNKCQRKLNEIGGVLEVALTRPYTELSIQPRVTDIIENYFVGASSIFEDSLSQSPENFDSALSECFKLLEEAKAKISKLDWDINNNLYKLNQLTHPELTRLKTHYDQVKRASDNIAQVFKNLPEPAAVSSPSSSESSSSSSTGTSAASSSRPARVTRAATKKVHTPIPKPRAQPSQPRQAVDKPLTGIQKMAKEYEEATRAVERKPVIETTPAGPKASEVTPESPRAAKTPPKSSKATTPRTPGGQSRSQWVG